jgi:hypothetical protein
MKNVLVLAAGLVFTLSGFARDVAIAGFDPDQLHLIGSYCTFERKPHDVVLASDWVSKFWMKVDGRMIELVSHKTDDEAERQLASKRWHETLSSGDLTVELSLFQIGRGEDSAAYKGYLELRRRSSSIRIPVTGGCAA